MLRHIPNKYTAPMVLAALDAVPGLKGRYDFFYLPLDARRGANLGFAFINCADAAAAAACTSSFHGAPWPAFCSRKVCAVCPARVQGRAALAAHFRGAKFGSGGGGGGSGSGSGLGGGPLLFEVEGGGGGGGAAAGSGGLPVPPPPPPPPAAVAGGERGEGGQDEGGRTSDGGDGTAAEPAPPAPPPAARAEGE